MLTVDSEVGNFFVSASRHGYEEVPGFPFFSMKSRWMTKHFSVDAVVEKPFKHKIGLLTGEATV